MHHARFIALALGTACLAGCGDSGGGVVSTPVPVALFPLNAANTFQTITGTLAYTGTVGPQTVVNSGGNAVASANGVNGRDATVTFSYDPSSSSYTVTGGGSTASFSAANATTATGYASAFAATSGTVSNTLLLYGNATPTAPATEAPVQLTYTSFGFFTHTDSTSQQTSNTYFLFGQPTGSTAMPTTGTATYTTTLSASMLQYGTVASQLSRLGGTASFSADFASGSVSTAIDLQTAGGFALGSFSGTGTISSDQFKGSLTSTDSQFLGGGFAGGFNGPTAREMGYTFWVNLHNPDPYAGAAIAPSNTAISGVVVGAKK
jgi:hypothetical protein